ncbi:MAG: hypothetical protein WD575_02250 [Nitriliruptoraceae bacterium]
MRHTAVLVVVASLMLACTTSPSPPSDEARVWRAVVPPAIPHPAGIDDTEPATGRSAPTPDPQSSGAGTDASGLELRAADEIIRRLETEGLYVLALTTDLRDIGPRHAVVLVAVLHGTGESYPHDSRYRVRLDRAADAWQVTGIETAP